MICAVESPFKKKCLFPGICLIYLDKNTSRIEDGGGVKKNKSLVLQLM